jgi:RHS repeat-associated protein
MGQTIAYAYKYDSVSRLTEVQHDGQPVANYEYDGNGNRLSVTTPVGSATSTFDAQDRLVTHGAAFYDFAASGELRYKAIGADTTRYEYDALGNLRAASLPNGTRVEYVIDALNRRVARMLNGQVTHRLLYANGSNPVAEVSANGHILTRFVYATHASVPDYMVREGTTYRLVRDHIGSVRLVVDVTTGAVAQRVDYDEYGRVTLNSNPGFQPFGFAGGLHDDQTGLTRFGARDYDSETGRWTTKDPIGFAGGSNMYQYVTGDPVNYVDPSGLDPCKITTALGVVIVDQSIAHRTRAFINEAVALGYTRAEGGQVNSSFRDGLRQQYINSQKGTGGVSTRVAAPGASPHEAGFALDFNWKAASCDARRAPLDAAKRHGFRQSYPGDDPQHFFAGGYGPFASKEDAIRHNQQALEDAGGMKNLPACELLW